MVSSIGLGGRASDSGFLDSIEPADVILADRGFPIYADLMRRLARLEIPPANSGLYQMKTGNVKKAKKIANARIRVERAIGRPKRFTWLKRTLRIQIVPLLITE
jgi:hypothetical protein